MDTGIVHDIESGVMALYAGAAEVNTSCWQEATAEFLCGGTTSCRLSEGKKNSAKPRRQVNNSTFVETISTSYYYEMKEDSNDTILNDIKILK